VQSREGGKPIEIRRADARHGNLDGLSARSAKLAEQPSHGARRDSITMRVGKYDARSGAAQALDGARERGPFDRCVAGTATRQPALEDLTDPASMSRSDQRTREMHACRHCSRGENVGSKLPSGQPGLALESFAYLADTVGASTAERFEMGKERRIRGIETEPDDVQGLTVPAAGDFDAIDVLQTELGAGRAGGSTAGDRVVIGECCNAHPASSA